jgi:hypothetical protein
MSMHDFAMPENWTGYRNIDEVINVQNKMSEAMESEEEEMDGMNSSPDK